MKLRHILSVLVLPLFVACSSESGGTDAGEPDGAPVPDGAPGADGQPPSGAPPAIDGELDDWQGIPQLATDPAGDAVGGFDVTGLWATSRGTTLYLRLELDRALNASAGPTEEGTLLIEVTHGGRWLTVDLRGRTAYLDGDPTRTLRWREIDYGLAPTHASDRFELRMDLARIEATQGEMVSIDVAGSDALSAPVSLALQGQPHVPTLRSTDRPAGTDLRVASLNTEFDGLSDPTRGPALGRLIKAVAADIYCFQEVFTGSAAAVAAGLESVDPHGDGGTWTAHQVGDAVVATRGSFTPLPAVAGQRFAGGAIEAAGGKLVVFSLRLTCCGYTGSTQDQQRIAEMQQLVSAIQQLRDGTLGAALDAWRQAPVVVVGDWNMVGSRTPLDMLEDPAGPSLSNWMLRHLLGQDVYTWESEQETFPPGKLDLLVHDPTGLERRGSFLLDSRELDSATLAQRGLQQDDSTASDHLMLVADFAFKQGAAP